MELLEEKSGFHPEDELEVMGPEHFILPACILLGGLTAASITFLCEILYYRKFRGKNTTIINNNEALDNNKGVTKDKDNTQGNTIIFVKPTKKETVVKRKGASVGAKKE